MFDEPLQEPYVDTQAEDKKTIEKLRKAYQEAEQVDKPVFAEMRSNILMVSGDHYQKKMDKAWERMRLHRGVNDSAKIRITKNHIQNILQYQADLVTGAAPGVKFGPKNDMDLDDQKVAELANMLWSDFRDTRDWSDLTCANCDDMFQLGEVHGLFWFNPSAGLAIGQDEEGNTIRTGKIEFEPVYGFNLLRDPNCEDIRKSPYLIHRKMSSLEGLKAAYPNKAGQISANDKKTYVVFDAQRGYRRTEGDEVMVANYYYRPSKQYPDGYFYQTVEDLILDQGTLPGGIFPIVSQVCDKSQTLARGYGKVRVLRPYQIEVNRTISKMAEHQVTLGDDKILTNTSTKISAGVAAPGVRHIKVSGNAKPTVMEGRTGSQYLPYLEFVITGMYRAGNTPEKQGDEFKGQVDPFTLLYRSGSQKSTFNRYIKKFEAYQKDIAKLYIQYCKLYMTDEDIVEIIGHKEMINIPEFRKRGPFEYSLKVDAQGEDLESRIGQQMSLQQILQYVGKQLDPQEIGKIIRQMPFANKEQALDTMTLSWDKYRNDALAMERGIPRPASLTDDHSYMIKNLDHRMSQQDFETKDPQIQQLFAQRKEEHQNFMKEIKQQQMMETKGSIPTTGALVPVDLYVGYDPEDPTKTRRARLPHDSMQWLMKALKNQGTIMEETSNLAEGTQAQMAVQEMGDRTEGSGNPTQADVPVTASQTDDELARLLGI